MKSRKIFAVLSAVVLLGIVGTGCDTKDDAVEKDGAKANAVSSAVTPEAKASKEKSSAWLGEFFGDKVVLADGSEVSTDTLAGKTIGIYFSAHWCQPCREFTPILVKAYNEITAAGKPFDLVFVSSDYTVEDMFNYMTETKMPWKGVEFGSSKAVFLARKYEVEWMPTLIIVDKDGNTVSSNGRGDIIYNGADAFDDWK